MFLMNENYMIYSMYRVLTVYTIWRFLMNHKTLQLNSSNFDICSALCIDKSSFKRIIRNCSNNFDMFYALFINESALIQGQSQQPDKL